MAAAGALQTDVNGRGVMRLVATVSVGRRRLYWCLPTFWRESGDGGGGWRPSFSLAGEATKRQKVKVRNIYDRGAGI